MSKNINDFWNAVAIQQIASGTAPSVRTKEMQKALAGDKRAANKVASEIDIDKNIIKSINTRRKNTLKQCGYNRKRKLK
jgi:hypothetical protein